MTALEFNYELTAASKALRPFALRLTRDSEDANDLIQETMLKAISNRNKFSDGTNLRAWLYTIMRNLFITNYQRLVRKNTFIDNTDSFYFVNSGTNSTPNLAIGDFVMKDINSAIEILDETFRKPFMMYFNGYKYEEIAENLNIPIGTVKNRIHIARKELKDHLKVYTSN